MTGGWTERSLRSPLALLGANARLGRQYFLSTPPPPTPLFFASAESKELASVLFVSADSAGFEMAYFDTVAQDFVSADSTGFTDAKFATV